MPYLSLLADATDVVSGGAGWAGAGMLGGVLFWLLKVHLPAKDAQVKDLVDAKDKQGKDLVDAKDKQVLGLVDSRDALVRELTTRFDQVLAAQGVIASALDRERRSDFKDALATVVAHCEHDAATMAAEFRESTAAIVDLREALEHLREAYLLHPPAGGKAP